MGRAERIGKSLDHGPVITNTRLTVLIEGQKVTPLTMAPALRPCDRRPPGAA